MRPGGGRLSRVWVVSGVVLSLTGLSLAAFGAWLAGNANCDAGDLGRQCVIASLGLSVIGAALVAGGVLRLRRVGEDGEGREAEPSAGLAERPGLVALALAVVGLVLLSLILPAPALPADVFARGAPALATPPSDLLPGEIGGAPRTGLVVAGLNRSVEAVADYADGVLVVVTRFNATTEILPGDVNFVGTLYSFGATLSFTIAHASLVMLRATKPERDSLFRARPNLRLGGIDWPLFAIFGGLATGISFLVIVVQNAATRWVGIGWLVIGFVVYAVYRRVRVKAPLAETVKAPPAFGPALALEYRRLIVPVIAGQPSDDAMDVACRLAAEKGSRIVALSVIEVPLDRHLSERQVELEAHANRELDEAVAIGDSYGVRVVGRLDRARSAGQSIVAEAAARDAEIIVIGSPRQRLTSSQAAVFGKTVDYVLKHAPCRVLVTASVAS